MLPPCECRDEWRAHRGRAVAVRRAEQRPGFCARLAAQQVTVEERAATVTPEPANNVSATVLAGNDLEALSDNPDDLISDLIAIAGRWW